MLQQTDFSESGWTGPGMMEPMIPSTPMQPPTPAPAPAMGEPKMGARKPARAAAKRKKKAARPKAKKKAKRARPRAKAKRAKAKRKPARRRR
jgi:hypothetical protein